MSLTVEHVFDYAEPEQLNALIAVLAERIHLEPPEANAMLQPVNLHVTTGLAHGINSQATRLGAERHAILMGGDLSMLCEQYARAAATYFLAGSAGDSTPSSNWPAARASLARTLDSLASPAASACFDSFEVTQRQESNAHECAAYAYRFAACHEIAHVVLGHLNQSTERESQASGIPANLVSQRRESAADSLGLRLVGASLPNRGALNSALPGAIYFFHATALLDLRLMLMAPVLDFTAWNIAHTHPPRLARVATLAGPADALFPGAGQRLRAIHTALERMDAEIAQATLELLDDVEREARELMESEAAIAVQQPGTPTASPANERAMSQLIERSPMGVFRALESQGASASERERAIGRIQEQYALLLPPELRQFRGASRQERAREQATRTEGEGGASLRNYRRDAEVTTRDTEEGRN